MHRFVVPIWIILSACTPTYSSSTTTTESRTASQCTTVENCRLAVTDARRRLLECPSCPGLKGEYEQAQRELAVFAQQQNTADRRQSTSEGADKMAALRAAEEERQQALAVKVEERREAAEEREQRRQEREAEDQRGRDEARAKEEAEQAALEAKMQDEQYGLLVMSEKICGIDDDLKNYEARLADMKRTNRRSGTIRPEDQRELVENIEAAEAQRKKYRASTQSRFGQPPKPCGGTWRKALAACLAAVQYENSEAGTCEEPYATAFELLRGGFELDTVSE